jgi:uncharacterized protein (TIGR02597 family)
MKSILRLTAFVGLLFWSVSAQGATVSTVPQGYVTISIAPSLNGTAFTITPFFPPLHPTTSITGQNAGVITGVGASTITNSNGGWTASALSGVSEPYFVKINSGTAVGRIFQITANTSTQLTVNTQGLDLTASIANGDQYEIVPGDTLSGVLGTPADGIVGGTSAQFNANQTDKVLVNDAAGVARFYYYDTSVSQWRRLGSATNQNNLLISPKAGMLFYRISTAPLSLTFLGKVPNTNSQRQIPTTGTTILAPYYPVDITLGNLGIHSMPLWRKLGDAGVTLNDTDRVIIKNFSTGAIQSYYYDGTAWKRVGSGSNQNNIVVQAGSAIYCTRFGTAGQSDTWTQSIPYDLNS